MKKILIALSVTGILLLNSLSVFASCPVGACEKGSAHKCCGGYNYKCNCVGINCNWYPTAGTCS